MRFIEESHQITFMEWLAKQYPDVYKVTFAIPNGGKRNLREAARLKQQGVKPGVPDILVAYPVKRTYNEPCTGGLQIITVESFPGLFIEMKRPIEPLKPKPTISAAQKAMMSWLSAKGYKCVIAYGFEDAVISLKRYLNESVLMA